MKRTPSGALIGFPGPAPLRAISTLIHATPRCFTLSAIPATSCSPNTILESSSVCMGRIIPSPTMSDLKSHQYFDPRYPKVLYIVRDPRDVVLAQYHFGIKQRLHGEDYPLTDYVSRFLANDTGHAYGSWFDHMASWYFTRCNDPGFLLVRYDIERNGKVLVICTDVEHGDQIDPQVVRLAQRADLLVHDAQYTAEELPQRRGWGHSSYDQAMQVAEMAGAKRVAMTHHDPDHDDEFLLRLERLCQERFKECVVAREGTELEL